MSNLPPRPPLAVLVLALSVSLGPLARADDRATAQALFDEAMTLMASRGFDQACPKLEAVVRLEPKVGARLELARCYEEWGKIASAWSRYRAAGDAARATGDARAATADAKVAALALRVPKLSVSVVGPNRDLRGFSVRRDGVELGSAEWDTALPMDPGKHVVVATAPGKQGWTGAVEVMEGGTVATVVIPALLEEPAGAGGLALPVGSASGTLSPAPIQDAATAPQGGGPPRWPWVAGGAGLVAVGVAAGFGADWLSAQKGLQSLCGPSLDCRGNPNQTLATQLNGKQDVDRVLFAALGGAGVVALGVSVFTIARAPKARPATRTGLAWGPLVGPSFAGSSLKGAF